MKLRILLQLILILGLATAGAAAAPADPREAAIGKWEGTSLCTKARTVPSPRRRGERGLFFRQ